MRRRHPVCFSTTAFALFAIFAANAMTIVQSARVTQQQQLRSRSETDSLMRSSVQEDVVNANGVNAQQLTEPTPFSSSGTTKVASLTVEAPSGQSASLVLLSADHPPYTLQADAQGTFAIAQVGLQYNYIYFLKHLV